MKEGNSSVVLSCRIPEIKKKKEKQQRTPKTQYSRHTWLPLISQHPRPS